MFVFGVVRNPFSRAVSAWRYCFPPSKPGHISFAEFVGQLALHPAASPRWTWHQRVHICPQASLLCDPATGKRHVNAVLRFEYLNEDFKSIVVPVLDACVTRPTAATTDSVESSERSNVGGINPALVALGRTDLPTLNAQAHVDFREFYSHDPSVAPKVVAAYRRDFELFGYSTDVTDRGEPRSKQYSNHM